MFNVVGFNKGIGYTSNTKAKKLNSFGEAIYRLVSTAGNHVSPGEKAI